MSNHAPKVDLGSKLMFLVSAVAILLVVLILLNSLVNTYQKNKIKGEIDSSYLVKAASDNLMPIGFSSTSDTPVATNAAGRAGKEIYDAVCTSCHTTGVLDSPKLGDKTAWEKRSADGLDALVASAMKGKGSMPAKGGDPSISNAEMEAVILYITKDSGLDLGSTAPEAKKTEEKTEEKKVEVVETPAKEESPEPEKPKAPKVTDAPVVEKEVTEAPAKTKAPLSEPVIPKFSEVEDTPAAVKEVVEAPAKTEAPVTPKIPEAEDAPVIAKEVTETPAKAEAPKPADPVVIEASTKTEATVTPKAPEVEKAPVVAKEVTEAPAISAAILEAGKKVYDTSCFACHATGVAGSPKLGDKDIWAPRIATGTDTMYKTAIKGKGAMPPKGGNMSLSDDDVKAAVDYMVSKSQ